MSTGLLQSSRDWLVIATVSAATFLAYATIAAFTEGRDWMNGSAGIMGARAVLSVLLAFVLLVIERRRPAPSFEAAVWEGLRVAVIIIIVDNLGGPTGSSAQIAVRTAFVLVALPLLGVLTHFLSRGRMTAAIH